MTDFQIDRTATDAPSGRTIVIHPVFREQRLGPRHPEARLDEAVGLTAAIGLAVHAARVLTSLRPHPSFYMGKGSAEVVTELAASIEPEVIVVDAALSPVQQRNLERLWQTKVIDRTGLILEIFGERAQTREGQLQVELAHLGYQRSRLVRSWTHLERQRGGGRGSAGFMGGPGERQIELDRRLIDDRMDRLRKDLEEVKRTRGLHRAARGRVPYPVIALVGYTNAGKSTLFNRLTGARVFSKDLLFATLDPTMRAINLGRGDDRRAILSDTVGFISDLPTQLIAAFRATLEEVAQADLIVHVRDISHPDAAAQKQDVVAVLSDLGVDVADSGRVVEAWNKIDQLDEGALPAVLAAAADHPGCLPLSAVTGQGCADLIEHLASAIDAHRPLVEVEVDLSDGRGLAWLYRHGTVLQRSDDGCTSRLTVRLDTTDLGRLDDQGGIHRVA